MVFYAALPGKAMESPAIIVPAGRNNPDDQLCEQFCDCRDFLRQTPEQKVHFIGLLHEKVYQMFNAS
jgi:type I restriction enzyme R subunit